VICMTMPTSHSITATCPRSKRQWSMIGGNARTAARETKIVPPTVTRKLHDPAGTIQIGPWLLYLWVQDRNLPVEFFEVSK
jgi:hypothetical protein